VCPIVVTNAAASNLIGCDTLLDLTQLLSSIGAVLGASVGIAAPASSDRELVENIVAGAALGGVIGLLLGFSAWVGTLGG